jgi:hypothetical protein
MTDAEIMTDVVQFADDVELFLFEDEGLVFCEGTQSLYTLNTTATYIWICCEKGLTRGQIATSLSETFQIDPSKAAAYLRDIQSRWTELGLLAQAPRKTAKPPRTTAGESPVSESIAPTRLPASDYQRKYRVLGQTFALRYGSASVEERVHPLLAHLEIDDGSGNARILDIQPDRDGFRLVLDSRPVATCSSLEELGPLTSYTVFTESFAKDRHFLAVHAAAVARAGRCLLMPGTGGVGKTSLTAALLREGFQYLSDDVTLLDAKPLGARGLPYSLCIKESGLESLSPYYERLSNIPVHQRADGKRVRYLTPPRGAYKPNQTKGIPVHWIVFPHYEPSAQTALGPLNRPEALRRLMAHAARPRHLGRAAIFDLVQWIRSVDCFDLSMASLPEPVELLQALVKASHT